MSWIIQPSNNSSAKYLASLTNQIKNRLIDIYTNRSLSSEEIWKKSTLWSPWETDLGNNLEVPIYAEIINDIRHGLYYLNNTFTFVDSVIKIPSVSWVTEERSTDTQYPFYLQQESNIDNCTKISANLFIDLMCKIEILENI